MKFLIWLVIGFAVVTWIMRLKANLASAVRGSHARSRKEAPPAVETMLQCAGCGTHFPASEALTDAAGAAYCCEEHRAQRALSRR
jgi:uncharacterized protein